MPVKLIDARLGKYRIIFTHNYKIYKKTLRGVNRKLALEVEAQMRSQLVEGTYFPARALKRLAFEHVADRFLKEYAKFKKSADKIGIYVNGAVRFFKNKALHEIKPVDVQRFREELGHRMCPVSVNHYHRAVRRLIYWAEEQGLFRGDNPASGKRVKLENERKYWRTDYLQPDQFKNLLEKTPDRIKPIVLAATFTGFRKSELRDIRRKNINLDSCTILIKDSKNGDPGSVPIPDLLFPTLASIVKQAQDPEQPIFNFKNFERLWQRARRDAGLGHLHLHDLRHTYASHIIMKTGDLPALQKLLRQKDYRQTERYAHLAPGHLRKAALTLDETFSCLRPTTTPETVTDNSHANTETSSTPDSIPSKTESS